ncbi:24532_t:CDS:1, partial [Gigaspora rosea]
MNTRNDILNNLPLSELHYNINQLFTCQSSTSEQLLKPYQEQNEIVTSQEIEDCQNNSSEEENFRPNQSKKRCQGGGPKRNSVWDDFNTGDSLGDGHYGASYKYCSTIWNHEKPQTLKRHLERKCAE